jgi:hypothetical protein
MVAFVVGEGEDKEKDDVIEVKQTNAEEEETEMNKAEGSNVMTSR